MKKRTRIIAVCFLGLITVLMFLYVKVSTSMIEKDITNAILQSIEQVEENVSYWMKYTEQAGNMIFGSSIVQSSLKTPAGGENLSDQYNEMSNLNNFINNIESNQPITVELYVPNNKFYANDRERFFSMKDCMAYPWYDAMKKSDGRILWISDNTSGLVSCVRIIKDVNNYRSVLGAVRVSMRTDYLQGILDNIHLENGNKLFIINESGLIISGNGSNTIGKQAFNNNFTTRLSTMNRGVLWYKEVGLKYSVMFTDIGDLHWKIIAKVPTDELISTKTSVYTVFSLTLIILLIIILVTFVLSAFYNGFVHNRIR